MENYTIKLECSAMALAELIKMGLIQNATILEIKDAKPEPTVEEKTEKPAFDASRKLPTKPIQANENVMPMYQNPAYHKSRSGYKQQMKGWDFYSFILDMYHPQKAFTTGDIFDACQTHSLKLTRKAASSFLTRFRRMNLVKAIGTERNGYIYETLPPVRKSDFQLLVANYNKNQVKREQTQSANANRNKLPQWEELRRKFARN